MRRWERWSWTASLTGFTGRTRPGLSIAQSIAKKHRGSITAYQKGTTIGFRVDLK